MAGAELRASRLHPVPKMIAKYPLRVVIAVYLIFIVLAIIGGTSITVSFGNPSGRTAYSPTDALETYRMDMWINAQNEVKVEATSAEQQTSAMPGFTVFFEEELPNGEPNLSADIFTDRNLAYMLRAQRIITEDPNYEKFCLRCAVEETLVCKRTKATYESGLELEAAINSDTEVAAAADDTLAKASSACDLVPETCPIKSCAQEVVDLVDSGAGNGTLTNKVQTCILLGARLASEGACQKLPGCKDATKKEPKCQHAYSPLNYFYNEKKEAFVDRKKAFKELDSEIKQPDAEDIPDRVSVYPANFFLPAYYEKGDLEAHMTRFTHLTGLPLDGYDDPNDREDEQEAKIDNWMISVYPKLQELMAEIDAEAPGLKMRWLGPNAVINDYFNTLLFTDLLAMFGSIIFVWVYMRYHTGSAFIASTCLGAVMLCFPVGAFWSVVVFNVRFFDPLNAFLLFILLGLGADGVFIVFDAWEQSASGVEHWQQVSNGDELLARQHRMSYVWRRASRAMMACNGTTALAFIAVIPSPIMPMAAFGILSAFAILHNWLIDVTLVPALIQIWEERLRPYKYCCCVERPAKTGDEKACCLPLPMPGASKARDAEAAAPKGGEGHRPGDELTLNRTEAFFRDTYAPFVFKYKYGLLGVVGAFIVVMIYFTTQLRPDTESPQFLPDRHPLWKAIVSLRQSWLEGGAEVRGELWMVWGIQENDYEGRTKFEFGTEVCNEGPCGSVVFDESFDPAPAKMQNYLLKSCEQAAKIDAGKGDKPGDFVYDQKISRCLMKDFRGYLSGQGRDFPVEDEDKFWDLLHEYLRPRDGDEPAGEGYGYVQDKLVKVGKEGGSDHKRMYFLIQGVFIDFSPQLFYGTPEIRPGHTASFEFEREWNEKRPSGQPEFFVTTDMGLFTAMRMQEAYISSTFTGVATALGFALASLLVFVANVVVALLAFVCIGGVVCCTLGIMVLQGWALGPIEAICATIVVGFSVDYVVHYALAYVNSGDSDRRSRVTFALVEVGISVQAGAVTTLGASAFLLATTISFFTKFGIFMMVTIAFSLITANLAFISLLAICGPEGDTGDLRKLYARLRGKELEATDTTSTDTYDDTHAAPASRAQIAVEVDGASDVNSPAPSVAPSTSSMPAAMQLPASRQSRASSQSRASAKSVKLTVGPPAAHAGPNDPTPRGPA